MLKPSVAPCAHPAGELVGDAAAGVPTKPALRSEVAMTTWRSDRFLASASARHSGRSRAGPCRRRRAAGHRDRRERPGRPRAAGRRGRGRTGPRPTPGRRRDSAVCRCDLLLEDPARLLLDLRSSVAPRMICVPGRILMSSSGRPAATQPARGCRWRTRARRRSRVPCAEKMTSALRRGEVAARRRVPGLEDAPGGPGRCAAASASSAMSNCDRRSRCRTPSSPPRRRRRATSAMASSAQPSQIARAARMNSPGALVAQRRGRASRRGGSSRRSRRCRW